MAPQQPSSAASSQPGENPFVHLLQAREASAALSARERDAQIESQRHSSTSRLCFYRSSSLPRAGKSRSGNSTEEILARDAALRSRDALLVARDKALRERDEALRERDNCL